MILYFILTINYILCKQKSLLVEYGKIKRNFFRVLSIKNKTSSKYEKMWYKYCKINCHINKLCNEIESLDRFWSRYVSNFYFLIIGNISYSYYILIFVQENFTEKYVFVLLIGYFTFILFILMGQCTKIIHNNRLFVKQNQTFMIIFQSTQILSPNLVLKASFK